MDYLALLQVSVDEQNSSLVLAKTLHQDIWNLMLKEKINLLNDLIYCNFIFFIHLMGYEHLTFHISRKNPWTLFSGCKTIFRILKKTFWTHKNRRSSTPENVTRIYMSLIFILPKKHIHQRAKFYSSSSFALSIFYLQWNLILVQLVWHSLCNTVLV